MIDLALTSILTLIIVLGTTHADDPTDPVPFPTKYEVNMFTTCDDKSVVKTLWANATFDFEFYCGPYLRREYYLGWDFEILIGQQTKHLHMSKLHWTVEFIEGNFLMEAEGIIDEPEECAGDRFQDTGFIRAQSPNACNTTGVSRLDFVDQPMYITGKCASFCYKTQGTVKLDPPINKDGHFLDNN